MEQNKRTRILNYIIFPLILLFVPLFRCNIGVDVTDTGYSLGSFIYQGEQMGEEWVRFATYLATVIGSFFARLPFGDTMLGMNIYTGLFVSVTALISYFFLQKKIPGWIAFAGEFLAICLCWCPTVILYNYVTYFLFTVMVILLYQGIFKEKKRYFILAGVVLGLNVMTRFPNITHAALIVSVWYAGWLRKDKLIKVLQDTLWCLLGFLIGFGGVLLTIVCTYGAGSYLQMLQSLFGGNGGVEGHSLGDMLWSIVDAYFVGGKWFLFVILVVLGGIVLFAIKKEQFIWIKRVLYFAVIAVLVRFFYGRGMFNFRYYAYESMFQWVVLFLIIAMVSTVIQMSRKEVPQEQKILASMLLLLILVTPLGSDNYLYPNINNLFLVAPVVLYWLVGYICEGQKQMFFVKAKVILSTFPIRAMLGALLLIVFIQSIGFGFTFVFRDGMLGEKRDTQITQNQVLKGMITNAENAEALEGITEYCETQGLTGKQIILYGDIPALSCFLKMPTAISTSWTDLDSYTVATMQKDMQKIEQNMQISEADRPVIIVSVGFDAWLTEDAEAMNWFNVSAEEYKEDAKAALIKEFITKYQYQETYLNNKFVVLE